MVEAREQVAQYMQDVVSGVRSDVGWENTSSNNEGRFGESSMESSRPGPRARFLRARDAWERHENRVHAWAVTDFDAAEKRSDRLEEAVRHGDSPGALAGWTVGVKDVIDVVGFPTRNGSDAPPRHPSKDASSVQRLKREGANILGKTETHEFAYGLITPQTTHAFRPDRIAGGSSGGAAVAVANGSAEVALGTDTGGSVRVPAALNGVLGFKPTHGRLALDGVTPLSPTLDHLGVIASTWDGLEGVFSVLDSGSDVPVASSHGLTMGYPPLTRESHVQPDIASALSEFLRVGDGAGATSQKVELPLWDKVPAIHYGIMGPEASAEHAFLSPEDRSLLGEETRSLLDGGHTIPATDYLHALRWREEMRRLWVELFNSVDVLVLPTTPVVAPYRGEGEIRWPDGAVESVTDALVRWCVPANITGLPALTIPFGCDAEGMPIGLQVVGPPESDRWLLGTVRQLVEKWSSSTTTTEEAGWPRRLDLDPEGEALVSKRPSTMQRENCSLDGIGRS